MRRFGLALITLTLTAMPALGGQPVADHLTCYKVRDPLLFRGTVDLDSPQFGLQPGCQIASHTPPLFCVPSAKTAVAVVDQNGQTITPLPVGGPDPGDRFCYKIRCRAPFPPDTQATDQFGTRTVTRMRARLFCTPAVKGGPPGPTTTTAPMTTTTTTSTTSTTSTTLRFVDNGDTVTDNRTGLQWEKKDSAGGGADPANPHDVDNTYVWSNSGNPPDGPAFTDFLGKLNNCTTSDGKDETNPGFAGHCDWRLPTIHELKTIVDTSASGCGTGNPCINAIFGPTIAHRYYSATTDASQANVAWFVFFNNGGDGSQFKVNAGQYVRAVRRAAPCTPGTCGAANCGPTPDGCGGVLNCPCLGGECFFFCVDGTPTIPQCYPPATECIGTCEADCDAFCSAHLGCASAECSACP